MNGWITENAVAVGAVTGLLGLAVSVGALAVTAWRFVAVRRAEQRHEEYVNYHDLIHRLVAPTDQEKKPMLDSQIAVIFELRNYQAYAELTARILPALKTKWTKDGADSRLLEEIDLTLTKLTKRRKQATRAGGALHTRPST